MNVKLREVLPAVLARIKPPTVIGTAAGLATGIGISLWMTWPEIHGWSLAAFVGGYLAANAAIELLRRRISDRRSFNCASCGRHQPTPSVILTLGGTFPAEDDAHAGVCVVWCKACAPEDVLHSATLRHVHNSDMPELMVVLGALARRGAGRVTWLSQGTLDRLRKLGGMPVHPVTPERTVH